jgi:hypothetical protein
MSDLGDIGRFLKEGGLANLDWLEVTPEDYRATAALPKQNLDVQPDLQAIWEHRDESPVKYVENRADVPRTMGDLSAEHGHLRAKPEEIRKVARLAIMQSTDPAKLQNALLQRFDRDSIREARSILASVLAERGLLGPFYVDASDFPTCATGSAKAAAFVKRYANDARYVLAKPKCAGCIHAQQHQSGETCSVFHKEIKLELPYTDALAVEVEQLQRSKGKDLSKTASSPKERIRLAMLADGFKAPGAAVMPKPKDNVARLMRQGGTDLPDYQRPVDLTGLRDVAKSAISDALSGGRLSVQAAQAAFRRVASAMTPEDLRTIHAEIDGVEAPALAVYRGAGVQAPVAVVAPQAADEQLIAASSLIRKRDEDAVRMVAAKKAAPIIALLRREMLKGRDRVELATTLKHAYTSTDLAATRAHWEPLFREAGLYGVVYTTQDSFDDCKEGANFLASYNPGIRGVVAGSKCGGCIYNKLSRCMMYGKPLVKAADDLYTAETIEQVALEYRTAGVYGSDHKVWGQGRTNREILATMHLVAKTHQAHASMMPSHRMAQLAAKGHTMNRSDVGAQTSTLTIRQITKAASAFLNEGLYGRDLMAALRARFDPRDLRAAEQALQPVLVEQGLQGIHYIDPAIYDDYGKGCKVAARLHRSRLVPYIKLGSKCASCVHQAKAGFCSVINKPLVIEPPYIDKAAQQREVLASGQATQVDLASIVNNGASMMAEYEMQNGGLVADVDDPLQVDPLGVQIGSAGQGVKL